MNPAGGDGAPASADVLVVGEPSAGRRTLLAALQGTPCSTSASSAAFYSLKLDTKYYSACLRVCMSDFAASRSTAGALPCDPTQLQALVLVFDASSCAAWQTLQAWCQQHQTAEQLAEVEVRLVVATQMDRLAAAGASPDSGQQQLPPWLEQARAWCYSNGYEFIATAAGAPAVDAQLTEDGEQQGVARVLAAMQAHMWPSMVPKKQQQQQQQQRGPSSAAAAAATAAVATNSARIDQQSGDATATLQQQQQLHPGDWDAVKSTGSSSSSRCSSGYPSKPAQQPVLAAAGDDDDDDSNPFGLPSGGGLDDFEALMRQVRGARTRLSGLPDDKRRAAAAELALQLSSMMGLDGGSSGSDDDDDTADDHRDGDNDCGIKQCPAAVR